MDSHSNDISTTLNGLLQKFATINNESDLGNFRDTITPSLLHEIKDHFSDFMKFLDDLCQKQDTIRFWRDFLFEDCLPYISLYTSSRYRNWDMRTGSLKQLVGMYAAFDRQTYQNLLPRHLHDLAILPEYLIEQLKKGVFAIRLSTKDC